MHVVLALIEQPCSIKASPSMNLHALTGQARLVNGKVAVQSKDWGGKYRTCKREISTAEGLNSVSRSRHINRQ
jgi:hypothetical protein